MHGCSPFTIASEKTRVGCATLRCHPDGIGAMLAAAVERRGGEGVETGTFGGAHEAI
jgi:hypothetical protein